MRYVLWDTSSANLIGDFDSEATALAAVRDEIRTNDDAQDLVLERPEGGKESAIAGQELAQRAFADEEVAAG